MGNAPGSNYSNNSTPSSCETYQDESYTKVAMIAASSGTFSLVASLAVILVILVFKKYNFFIQRLILYLCIAVALNSASIVMRFSRAKYHTEANDLHRLCVAMAFIDQTTLWSVTLAFTCMTFNMVMVVLFNKGTTVLEMGYICFIFFFPLMFNWIPFIGEGYGEAGAWCWIRSHNYQQNCSENKMGLVMQYVLWYGPHYLLLGILFVAYIVVIFRVIRKRYQWRGLYTTSTEDQTQQLVMKEMVFPIIFYPLGFLLLNIFPLVNRIYDTFHDPNYILWILHATFSPLQGGYIALVYVLDRETMRRLNLRELKAYLFHRRTPVKEYPATKGFTDSYDATLISGEDEESLASTEEDKFMVNKGRKGRKDNGYGSTEERDLSSKYLIKSEKV